MLVKRNEAFALSEKSAARQPAAAAKPKINYRLRLKCVVLILLVAVLAMFTTYRSQTIVTEGYALVKMRSQTEQLEKDNERLKLDIARLKSPQRIKQTAVADLGMVVPEDVYFASSGDKP